jgi:hypothetical protein
LSKPIPKRSILPAKREFPNINSFFDGGVLIARRFTELLSELEPAILRLFLLLHLIIDLGVILLAVVILAVAMLWALH